MCLQVKIVSKQELLKELEDWAEGICMALPLQTQAFQKLKYISENVTKFYKSIVLLHQQHQTSPFESHFVAGLGKPCSKMDFYCKHIDHADVGPVADTAHATNGEKKAPLPMV